MAESQKLAGADKQRIKWLMKTEQWDSILRFFAYKIGQWNDEKTTGTNEFETLRMLHTKQGKVEGLEEFMNQLEHEALE